MTEKKNLKFFTMAFWSVIAPLFTDTNVHGKRKVSIGRAPLLIVLLNMCYIYVTTGQGPSTEILTFIGMAMAYNGFSKSPLAQGDGGNSFE